MNRSLVIKGVIFGGLIGNQICWMRISYSFWKDLKVEKLRYIKLYETAEYLVNIFNEHDIDLSAFDLIALGLITEDPNAGE